MFDAALFRKMPPKQYGDTMTCPLTGLVIPKTPAGNLAWRKSLIAAARTSEAMRRQIKSACAASPIYWINGFGWTYWQKRIEVDGHEVSVQGEMAHQPFITWWVQDQAILDIKEAIDEGHDATIDKSRDMGASWIVVSVFQWFFQFRPQTTFLELSRKETLVDRRGDMDSLFEKHRYMMRMQPAWLRPKRMKDNRLHLQNDDIGTAIEGESTNENAGQASRKTAILIDEASRIPNMEEIDLATADTSACRIFNSTPGGPSTHFSRVKKAMASGARSGKLIVFPWWMHPDKGRGAEVATKDGKEEVTSPWKEDQKARRSARNIAQNIDGDDGQAGDMFFNAVEIEAHRDAFQQPPLMVGNIFLGPYTEQTDEAKASVIRRLDTKALQFVENSAFRPWRFWVPLIDGRPNQNTRYVFGIDISNGSGGSNSVISVLDHYSNMIVAKWWDAYTTPEELAETAALAGVWFGGKAPPLVIFEKNGPGSIFGRKLLRLGYPAIYYQEVLDQKARVKTRKWGWHSSPAKKELLLGEYRDALKTNAIINPCREALDECLDYIYEDRPGSDQARVIPGSVGSEEGGGQALHGDHVVADALLAFGRKDLPPAERDIPAHAPKGSWAARKEAYRKSLRDSEAWSR